MQSEDTRSLPPHAHHATPSPDPLTPTPLPPQIRESSPELSDNISVASLSSQSLSSNVEAGFAVSAQKVASDGVAEVTVPDWGLYMLDTEGRGRGVFAGVDIPARQLGEEMRQSGLGLRAVILDTTPYHARGYSVGCVKLTSLF